MRKPETFTIDGVEYTIMPMSPEEGLPVLVRLSKLMAASFGQAIKGADSLSGLAEADVSGIDLGAAVMELSNRLNEQETLSTIKTLLDPRYVGFRGPGKDEGGTISLDHFAGDYGRMFKVLGKVLEVNYGRFFSGFKEGFARLLQSAPKKGKPSTQGK